MKSVVVDTNVVLSFVTDRDPRQQRRAARLFESAASRELLIVLPQAVLIEIVYVLRNVYRVPDAEIAGLLGDLLEMPNVEVVDEVPWRSVLELWPRTIAELADAMLVTVSKAGGHALASFDRRLTRGLRRFGVASRPLR